jgi:hypothetical protein
MGQDQTKPTPEGGSAATGAAGPTRTPSDLNSFEAEQAKMVHVTRASNVVSNIPEHEREAARLLGELNGIPLVKPLLTSTDDTVFLNRNEKISEEVLKRSATLAPLRIPHDRTVKALASYQTTMMREAAQATARTELMASKMQQTAFLCSQFKTVAWNRGHDAAVLNQSLAEAERLGAELDKLQSSVADISGMLSQINSILTPQDKAAVKAQIEEENLRQADAEKLSEMQRRHPDVPAIFGDLPSLAHVARPRNESQLSDSSTASAVGRHTPPHLRKSPTSTPKRGAASTPPPDPPSPGTGADPNPPSSLPPPMTIGTEAKQDTVAEAVAAEEPETVATTEVTDETTAPSEGAEPSTAPEEGRELAE